MLEQSLFLILPWQGNPARAVIVEPRSRENLGFVYRRPRHGPLAWLCWRKRFDLVVHESGDEPLLMTLRQSFAPWPSWYVMDAEGRHVGRVAGRRLLDGVEDRLAVLEVSTGIYRGEGGNLAETCPEEDGVQLTLLMGESASPFVKMVLLAAALIHNQDRLLTRISARRAGPPAPRSRP
jgi:hypothetical protein